MPTNALFRYGIRFGATSYAIVVNTDPTGPETLTFPATGSLDPNTDYGWWGDGGATDLFVLWDACLETHTGISTATTTFNSAWHLQTVITGDTDFTLDWDNGSTTLDDGIFGDDGDNAAGGTTLTSASQPQGILRFKRPPVEDTRPRQPKVGGLSVAISGKVRASDLATPFKERRLSFDYLNQTEALIEYGDATDDPEGFGTVEWFWVYSGALGYAFRYFSDEDAAATSYDGPYKLAPPRDDPLMRSPSFPAIRWAADFAMVATS